MRAERRNLGFATGFPSQFTSAERLADMEAASVWGDWVRMDLPWSTVEASEGVYDWSDTDDWFDDAVTKRRRTIAMLGYTPSWARTAPGSDDKHAPTSGDYAAFATFCAAAVARYGPGGTKGYGRHAIRHWEIWNEPNILSFWKPGPDPDEYAALLAAAYTAIKAADPGATVITAGLAPGATDGTNYTPADFWDAVIQVTTNFDAIGIHPYCTPETTGGPLNLSSIYNFVNSIQAMDLLSIARGVPASKRRFWATETGIAIGGSITAREQATMIRDYLVRFESTNPANVECVLFYNMRETGDGYGLRDANGVARPAHDVLVRRARRTKRQSSTSRSPLI